MIDLQEQIDQRRARVQEVLQPASVIVKNATAAGGKLNDSEKRTVQKALDDAKPLEKKLADLLEQKGLNQQLDDFGRSLGPSGGGKANLGAPSLHWDEKSLKELQTAALNRHPLAKASLTEANAPMSTAIEYRLSPWPFLREATRILALVPVEGMSGPSVHAFRATTAASAAAMVAEGADKPESSPVWEELEFHARKIAHYTRVNDEVIADFANFRSVIGEEMIAGLINAENDGLLNGDGIAPNLLGLLNVPSIQTQALGADSRIDASHKAITKLRVGTAFTEPSAFIFHPNDWEQIRLEKDANGVYIGPGPMAGDVMRLWNTKVVTTTQIAEGTGLVGNFAFAKVYLREAPRVEVAPNGGGTAEFIANQTLIRAEERLAGVQVFRPTAFCKLTGF